MLDEFQRLLAVLRIGLRAKAGANGYLDYKPEFNSHEYRIRGSSHVRNRQSKIQSPAGRVYGSTLFAQRMPMKFEYGPNGFADQRLESRISQRLCSQLPPRITRCVPVAGPVGFVLGETE